MILCKKCKSPHGEIELSDEGICENCIIKTEGKK